MKMNNFISKSISAKLITFFLLISLIPTAIVGIIGYSNSKRVLETVIGNNISAVMDSRAKHLENFVTVSLDVVNSASALSLFRENLYDLEKGINVEHSRAVLKQAMYDWETKSNVFYRAKILDSSGKIVASTHTAEVEGTERSEWDYFKEGLQGPYVSDPYISPDDNATLITYSCPIYAPGSTTDVIGVLAIHQATEAEINKGDVWGNGLGTNNIITNYEGLGETGETYLINREGLVISTTRFNDDIFLKGKISKDALNTLFSNSGLVRYKDYRGVTSIGKVRKIAGTNWFLVGELDYDEVYSPIGKLGRLMLLISVVVLIIVLLLAFFIARNFTRPVIQLTNVAKEMARGNMEEPIHVRLRDEIGELAVSFKTMQEALQDKAQKARAISEGNLAIEVQPLSEKDDIGIAFQTMIANLRRQLTDIGEGINVLASSSSEIMASATQLASSSNETATSVGETTATIEEVKQTALLSNNKAKAVSDNAIKMAEISKEGDKAIANTIEGMNKIKSQMNAIAAMVIKLSEQSQTIGEITATVNELAEQSNLLAVNASIEAAKAGEQGKGFTVVAQEIKLLANRSKEATAQVKSILREIQKSISSTVMATEEGGKAVDEGLKLTDISGDTIKALSENITDAANAAIQIAASSQQQLEGMEQIVTAMENIREASSQAATGTQQSAESVNELQKVGQKLDEMMKQYNLGK